MMKSLELLSDIALTFAKSDNIDVQMISILNKIGEYAHVSRVYIFMDNKEGTASSNIFEWCSEGIVSQKEKLQNMSYNKMPSFRKLLSDEGRIYSEKTDELPADIAALLKGLGVLSVVIYPLYVNQKISGFIGLDESRNYRKWEEKELSLLKTVSGILSTVYERHFNHEQIVLMKKNFENFFHTIDDFIIIGNTKGNILYANDAVKTKLGYSTEELFKMKIPDLHPKEKRDEAAVIIKEMFDKEREYCPLEIEGKNKKRIPVETRVWFGSWDDQDCIFGISKDISKEQEALQKFTKLFENNPALMGITDLTDRKITNVNTTFLEKTGYSKNEIIGKTSDVLDLFIIKSEQNRIEEELKKRGKVKNIELEIKCKNGNILCGLFSGEIIENQGKSYFLTVVVDITEQIILREKLESQKNRLQNIIESTHLGAWEWNVQTGETVFNERWAQIVGYKLEELSPISIDTWIKLSHPEDVKQSNRLLQKHFKKESEFYEFESRMKHKNGSWVWILNRGKVIEWDKEGRPLKMFGTHFDITEKKRMEEKFRMLFELSSVGMAMIDHETGEFLEVNKAVLQSTGYTKEEFLKLSFWDITPKEYEKQELDQIRMLNETGFFGPNEKEYIRKDGTRYPISIRGFILTDVDGRKIVWGIIEDISERKAAVEEIKRLALHDPLTDLPNRRLLSDRLGQAIALCQRENNMLALLIFDLDNFKLINDNYGHGVGDLLLKEVALRVKECMKRNTDTVARLGGDEFIVLFPRINSTGEAALVAKKICSVLNEPFNLEGHKINISASIGIAVFPEHGKDEKTLMKNADRALYQVKNAGRNDFRLFEKDKSI